MNKLEKFITSFDGESIPKDLLMTMITTKKKEPNKVYSFVEWFMGLYFNITKQKYFKKPQDMRHAKLMLDQFDHAEIAQKTRILLEACMSQSLWFTKDGLSAFTVTTLYSRWNEIQTKKELSVMEKVMIKKQMKGELNDELRLTNTGEPDIYNLAKEGNGSPIGITGS